MTNHTTQRLTCRNHECGRDIDSFEARSYDDPDYCEACGDLVIAFCPQPSFRLGLMGSPTERAVHGEEFHKIPTTDEPGPVEFSADQCDNCGGAEYICERGQTGRWHVRCCSCGTTFPVVTIPGRLAIW